MSTVKFIVSNMLAGLRLDGYNNYDQWHCKMKYLLSKNGSIDFIMEEIKSLNDRDNPDEVWRHSDDVKKDRSARFLMLCAWPTIFFTFMRIFLLRRPYGAEEVWSFV